MSDSYQNIHITAHLSSPIAIQGWLPLDSLLMAQEARRLCLPPVEVGGVTEIPIPLQRHARGFYHASFGRGGAAPKSHDQIWRRRRFPMREGAACCSDKVGKVQTTTGPLKSINLPSYTQAIPRIEWWCVGDLDWVRETVGHVLGLGARRGSGLGAVERWDVESSEEDWSLFYPSADPGVVYPSRVMPADLPELKGKIFDMASAVWSPPYWQTERAKLCAVPEVIG